jgi:hypothetical protein
MTTPSTLGGAPPSFDISSEVDAALGAPDTVDTSTTDGTEPVTSTDVPSGPEPQAEPALEPEPEPAAEPPASAPKPEDAPPAEALPDGVRERVVDGKRQMVTTPERWNTIYGTYKAVQQIEQTLGEPLTPEVVTQGHQARVDQTEMMTDFLSGEPESEQRFLDHFIQVAASARENGDVAHDPMVSVAAEMPPVLLERNPQAFYAVRDSVLQMVLPALAKVDPQTALGNSGMFSQIRDSVVRPTLEALLQVAAQSGDKNVILSAQHIQKALYGEYTPEAQIGRAAPVRENDQLAAERNALKEERKQLNDIYARRDAEQWTSWQQTANRGIKDGVAQAVDESLGQEIKEGFKDFPEDYALRVEKLNSEIREATKNDENFQRLITSLTRQARQARSEQRRSEIQAEIVNRYRTKAKLIADSKKVSLFSNAARALKSRMDATHQQRAQAALRREPGTGAAPVPKSLVPTPPPNGGWMDRQSLEREADALLNS